jgi:branched-chain amino acid transport system ATP-binding protein
LATPETVLAVDDVHTYYGDSYVLQGVTLEVPRGRIVAMLGRNGMGKTTLIRSIAGLTPPRRGTVAYRGRPISGLAPYNIARLGITLVPQGRRTFPSLSVRENLLLPTSRLARGWGARDGALWTLETVLDAFPRLRERGHQLARHLSGGEQQMLAIARALIANPDLILMDEPSEGLAPLLVRQIADIMRQLRDQGHTIFLVEQNLALALSVADQVHILSAGRIVYRGTPAELPEDPELLNRHLGI